MISAPSAKQFMDAECKQSETLADWLNFAERYGDFIAEFERKDGRLAAVVRWPINNPSRVVGV